MSARNAPQHEEKKKLPMKTLGRCVSCNRVHGPSSALKEGYSRAEGVAVPVAPVAGAGRYSVYKHLGFHQQNTLVVVHCDTAPASVAGPSPSPHSRLAQRERERELYAVNFLIEILPLIMTSSNECGGGGGGGYASSRDLCNRLVLTSIILSNRYEYVL